MLAQRTHTHARKHSAHALMSPERRAHNYTIPPETSCATVIDRGPTGVANGEQTSRNDAAHYLEHNSSVPKIRSSAHTRTRAHTRLRCCDDDNRIAMHEPECSRRATYCASCCTTTRTMDGRDREMRAHTAQVMSLVNLFRSNNSKGHHVCACVRLCS